MYVQLCSVDGREHEMSICTHMMPFHDLVHKVSLFFLISLWCVRVSPSN